MKGKGDWLSSCLPVPVLFFTNARTCTEAQSSQKWCPNLHQT